MFRTDEAKEDGKECGMVTVEAAFGIAALIAMLALLVGALSIVRLQADVCHAVREAARAETVGESGQAAASRVVSRPVSVSAEAAGEWLRVTASSPAASFAGISVGTLTCEVSTYLEPVAR